MISAILRFAHFGSSLHVRFAHQEEIVKAPLLPPGLLAAYTASEDLIRIGAYQKGSDPTLDKALAMIPDLNRFLMQKPGDSVSFSDSIAKLLALPS